MTTETVVGGMPMLAFMSHLALIHADGFATSITIFGKHAVEAAQAVRSAFSHNVPLPTQLPVALKTGEMGHVPSAAFGLGALVGKNDFITG